MFPSLALWGRHNFLFGFDWFCLVLNMWLAIMAFVVFGARGTISDIQLGRKYLIANIGPQPAGK